jgi:hypothetical protein
MKLTPLTHRKSKLQRTLENLGETLDLGSLGHSLPGPGSGKDLRKMVPESARTAGLVTAGVIGLTAGSAGISSYRRRKEASSDAS